ncbi:MAG: FtsX-like permease family protein [Pseudomonadota bacterium]
MTSAVSKHASASTAPATATSGLPLLWVFRVLASHWRRKPMQLATMVIGLACATALFSGVQALNMQAKASYAEAASVLGADQFPSLRPVEGTYFDQALYVELRRAGLPVSPVLQAPVYLTNRRMTVFGIDLVTMPRAVAPVRLMGSNQADEQTNAQAPSIDLVDFITPPWRAAAAPSDIAALTPGDGAPSRLRSGQVLPEPFAQDGVTPGVLFVDVGAAQAILDQPGRLSGLIYGARTIPADHRALVEARGLSIVAPSAQSDIARLTDSFHLNLTAFGYLSFLVGLLIVHAATGLAFEQRRQIMRTLRATGVSANALSGVLLLEMAAIAVIAGLLGVLMGYVIAAALLPNISLTLRGLYGASVENSLPVRPIWLVIGIAMSLAGAMIASVSMLWKARTMPVLASAQPQAWVGLQRRSFLRQAALGTVLVLVAGVLLLVERGLVAGFAMMGALLVGAALLLPLVLSGLLTLARRYVPGAALTQWFWADARQQLSGLSLALQALMLALAVNIGVGAMVSSFRDTFDGWLDQRLAAEIYVNPGQEARAMEIAGWLQAQDGIDTILPMAFAESRYADLPLSLFGFTMDKTYTENWPLLSEIPGAWAAVKAGDHSLINEQMARAHGFGPGDTLRIPAPGGDWVVTIAGVYSDYGNTSGQIMVTVETLKARFPAAQSSLFAVRAEPDKTSSLTAALTERYGLGETEIIDQRALKVFSKNVFEQTFVVTGALNVLTFMVAGVALFASLLSLSAARLPQLAPLWSMGLRRGALSRMELGKSVVLALLTATLAVPLGLGVAWILTNVINVAAFGWQLPLFVYPGQFLILGLVAVVTAFLAALIPALQLRRLAPARLVKVFAEER